MRNSWRRYLKNNALEIFVGIASHLQLIPLFIIIVGFTQIAQGQNIVVKRSANATEWFSYLPNAQATQENCEPDCYNRLHVSCNGKKSDGFTFFNQTDNWIVVTLGFHGKAEPLNHTSFFGNIYQKYDNHWQASCKIHKQTKYEFLILQECVRFFTNKSHLVVLENGEEVGRLTFSGIDFLNIWFYTGKEPSNKMVPDTANLIVKKGFEQEIEVSLSNPLLKITKVPFVTGCGNVPRPRKSGENYAKGRLGNVVFQYDVIVNERRLKKPFFFSKGAVWGPIQLGNGYIMKSNDVNCPSFAIEKVE